MPGENRHHHQQGGRHQFPAEEPEDPGEGIEAEHGVQVLHELVGAVHPGHHRDLRRPQHQGGVGGRVIVKQREDVES